jgi:hypothetical protein
MQHDATPGELTTLPPDQAEALEPAQELALAALLAGKPLGEAAAAAGCHRATLWRWMTGDPRFMARYNAGRREMADQARTELLTLGQSAIKAIRETLESPDPALRFKAAVKTLELIGCDGSPPAGPTDPEEVAEALESEAMGRDQQRETNRILRSLQAVEHVPASPRRLTPRR